MITARDRTKFERRYAGRMMTTITMALYSSCQRPSLFCKLIIVISLSICGISLVPISLETQHARRNSADDASSFIPPVSPLNMTDSTENNDTQQRYCTSPESKVSWPLLDVSNVNSNDFSCGMTSDTPLASFFRNVSAFLAHQYSEQCKQAVRFGVAFGRDHANKLRPFRRPPHKCVFMFVLQEQAPVGDNTTRSFGFETLIPVPRKILPYRSTRRNVKLFKFHGSLLFPFTRLLVWQDVKLKGKWFIPAEYYNKLLTTKRNDQACVAAVGLPPHKASFGEPAAGNDSYVPKYQDHCNTVVGSIKRRPNVTDSTSTLLQQCQYYQQRRQESLVSLDRGVIDSAFIVWNQHTTECRDFSARLACAWSREIQCYSDRDQISFPFVLQEMGLREKRSHRVVNATKHSLHLMDSTSNATKVHILRSKCHWYYRSFPKHCT